MSDTMKIYTLAQHRHKYSSRVLLAIDASTTATGYSIFVFHHLRREAVLIEYGCLRYPGKKTQWIDRTDWMVEKVLELYNRVMPDYVALECPIVTSTGRFGIANAAGVVAKLFALVFSIRRAILDKIKKDEFGSINLVMVRDWKGNLPKDVSKNRARQRWNWIGNDDNEADSIGIGEYYLREFFSIYPKRRDCLSVVCNVEKAYM